MNVHVLLVISVFITAWNISAVDAIGGGYSRFLKILAIASNSNYLCNSKCILGLDNRRRYRSMTSTLS